METVAESRITNVLLRPAVRAAMVCPDCRVSLNKDAACPRCARQAREANGVFGFEDEATEGEANAARHPFATYSMDTGIAQYVGQTLVEHEYYLRFLQPGRQFMVDLGGGDANASALWARRNPEAELVVADMDGHALAKAARRGLANLTPLRTSAERVPLADAAVDVVFSTYVVEHLYDWELSDFYREAMRLLKPGGRLVIQSDAPLFDKFIHPVLRLLRERTWRTSNFLERWKTSIRAIDHHNLKTAREQAAVIERHGFFVQGVEVPLLFSNNTLVAAVYEVLAGLLPRTWIERVFGTSYVIVARRPTVPGAGG
jgi:ubiquinone/menaquinone biosynthesis C-methylase UbiE